MRIKMLKQTVVDSIVLKVDEIADVTESIGNRLISNNIASKVEVEKAVEVEVVDEVDFSKMTTKELFDFCKEQGVALEKDKINGKKAAEKRKYLLSMLKGE